MEPTILTTLNVTRVSFGGGSVQTTVNANLPLDTPFEKLATFIRPLIDPNITPEKYRITAGSRLAPSVTTGASTYTGDLKINVNEPLAQYYKDYRRHHGRASGAKSLSDSSIDDEAFNTKKKSIVRGESSTITVGPARFKFNRTLRVPDNANRYALPPGLGTFPVAKVQDFRHSLPPQIKKRGGYIMPLFQPRGALGVYAALPQDTALSRYRSEVSTLGKRDEKPPNGLQDYVVGGKQPWLDGIVTEPGVVQQFVAMKLGYRYTVEEQLSDTMMGGIQIDVFPSIVGFATFYHGSSQRKLELALDRALSSKPGEQIAMTSTEFPVKTLRDMVQYITTEPVLNVSYVSYREDLYEERRCEIMNYCAPLEDRLMGVAAGGKITQKIYQDPFSPVVYDEENSHRVFIHTVSTAAWELITGVVCPVTPITHELYKAHHYPWFDLYDEHLPTVHHHDAFEGLSSITKLDTSPNGAQPQHSTRDTACVARPCGHSACSQCFGEGILGGCKCRVCKRKVDKYVTFDKPVPTVIQGGGSEGTWWEAEMQIEGVVREPGCCYAHAG
ncbi:hypothetical protein B0H14DRAFT_3438179 [Mycena olivaceomarginata]|nr:hypothetical protein B0H14DRAFT_3438179 [Mycena olivaceomarginata]